MNAIINLISNCILIYGHNTTVITPQCIIKLHKDSVTYVEQYNNVTCVYCLHQGWIKQTRIITPELNYTLAPGRYISVGSDCRYTSLISANHKINKYHTYVSKTKYYSPSVFVGTYSIFTALHTIPRLKRFTLDKAEDKYLNKVLLTVCILRQEGKMWSTYAAATP